MTLILPLILRRALANLSGFPVMIAPPLSAENSLYLEIARIIRKLTTQVVIATSNTIALVPAVFRFLVCKPPNIPNRTRYQATVEKTLAKVSTRTSLLLTWLNSCPITASSSSLSNTSNIPVVTATRELLGLLPVANALGTGELTIATLGFGSPLLVESLSTISCSLGYSSFDTILAPELHRTILSDKYHCARIITDAIIASGLYPTP